MKLYRGTTIKECESYKNGIPIGKKFTNELKEAKRFGKCIIIIEKNKNIKNLTPENEAFKTIKLKTKYFETKNIIKKFKIK